MLKKQMLGLDDALLPISDFREFGVIKHGRIARIVQVAETVITEFGDNRQHHDIVDVAILGMDGPVRFDPVFWLQSKQLGIPAFRRNEVIGDGNKDLAGRLFRCQIPAAIAVVRRFILDRKSVV